MASQKQFLPHFRCTQWLNALLSSIDARGAFGKDPASFKLYPRCQSSEPPDILSLRLDRLQLKQLKQLKLKELLDCQSIPHITGAP